MARSCAIRALRPVVFLVVAFAILLTPAAAATGTPAASQPSAQVTPAPLPTPRPDAVDASGDVSAFPSPGTPTASPTTAITFRGATAVGLASLGVTGSKSGAHTGALHPSSDREGTTFVPDEPFAAGEQVTVTTGLAVRGATNGTYTFAIGVPATFPDAPLPTPQAAPNQKPVDDLEHFVSRPDLTAPKMTVTANSAGASPGDVFVTPVGGDAQPALVILDQEGQPLWISPTSGARRINLAVQQYEGQPVLTWYAGSVVNPGVGQGGYVIADASYRPIAFVHAVNGYSGDIHDFTITPQGTAVFTIYDPVVVDATSVKGAKKQEVLEAVVQEIDIASGELRFEWHSLATVPLGDSYLPVPKTATDMYDYVHPNSITVDLDGNLLLSGRHTWTVYKIDRSSGALRVATRREARQLRNGEERRARVAARRPSQRRSEPHDLRQRCERRAKHTHVPGARARPRRGRNDRFTTPCLSAPHEAEDRSVRESRGLPASRQW